MIVMETLETVPVDLNIKYIAALSAVFGPLYGYTVEDVVVTIVEDFLKANADVCPLKAPSDGDSNGRGHD